VKGIPTLVLLDGATGKVLSTNGIETVMGDPKGEKVRRCLLLLYFKNDKKKYR
jgi:hypothetical protein